MKKIIVKLYTNRRSKLNEFKQFFIFKLFSIIDTKSNRNIYIEGNNDISCWNVFIPFFIIKNDIKIRRNDES